jgi:hypothetical protein
MAYAPKLEATPVPAADANGSGQAELTLPSRTAMTRFARASAPLAVAAVGIAVAWAFFRGGEPVLPDVDPRIRPAEFLYLDGARVVAFLSQLEDGLSDSERQTVSRMSAIDVGLTGAVAGHGSREATGSVERVVTPTGASRFNRLRSRLQDRGWLESLDAHSLAPLQTRGRFFDTLGRAGEGGFVEIEHVRLTVPPAVTVYRFARRSGSGDAKRFVGMVGANPRVPLSLRAERSPSVLFVGRYASLADESSLFFGEVTVLGKLIRNLPAGGGVVYRDKETLATYGPALRSAPAPILRKLQIRPASLGRDLRDGTTVTAPGAVIIPIAIYK